MVMRMSMQIVLIIKTYLYLFIFLHLPWIFFMRLGFHYEVDWFDKFKSADVCLWLASGRLSVHFRAFSRFTLLNNDHGIVQTKLCASPDFPEKPWFQGTNTLRGFFSPIKQEASPIPTQLSPAFSCPKLSELFCRKHGSLRLSVWCLMSWRQTHSSAEMAAYHLSACNGT